MHPSALNNAKDFFGTYSNYLPKYDQIRVVEIGSQDINGGLRSLCPNHFEYIGVDFQAGNGSNLLMSAERWLNVNRPEIKCIHASVLAENDASKNLFLDSSYKVNKICYQKDLLV